MSAPVEGIANPVDDRKVDFTDAISMWVGNQRLAEGMRREELAQTGGMQRALTLRNGLLVNVIRLVRLNRRESSRGAILAIITFMAEMPNATCYLTIKRIAKIIARTERSVRECIADLEQDGLIGVQRNKEGLPQFYWPLIPHALTTMGASVVWFADALSDKPRASGRPARTDNIEPKIPGTIVPPLSENPRNSSAKPPEHLQHSNSTSPNLQKGVPPGGGQPPVADKRTHTPKSMSDGQPSLDAALNPEIAFADRNVWVNEYGELEIGEELRQRLLLTATEEQINLALPRALERGQGTRKPIRLLEKINHALSYAKEAKTTSASFKTGFGGKTTRPSM